MDIVSALFIENFELRPVPGPSTRVDLLGAMFSMPAPAAPPVTVTPHLMVLIRSRRDDPPNGVLEVVFHDEDGAQVARNVSPFSVEPGKFTYRLVRAELEYSRLGTIEAHCRLVPSEHATVVPLTLLPPLA
jgi:hypothetical protein